MNSGLFRAASLRTRRAAFTAPGSPAIYAAYVTGFAWMCSWHAAQTVNQLLARGQDRGRHGVTDDRPPVLPQVDPAESRYQIFPALTLQCCLEAGPGTVAGDDLCLVTGGHPGDGGLVLGT